LLSADNLDETDGPSSSKKMKSNNHSDLEIKKQNKLIFKYRDFLKSSDDYIFTNKSNFVRIYFLGNLLSLTALIFFILYPEATLFSRMIVDVY